MIKATLYVREDPAMLANAIFSGKALYGMKSDMYMYVALKEEFKKIGIDLNTQDLSPVTESTFVLVLNETTFFRTYQKPAGQKLFLILSEPPVYNFDDWKKENHKNFDKVFTFDTKLVDHKKFIQYNYPIDFETEALPGPVSEKEFNERKLCTLMAGTFSVLPHKPEMKSLLYERYKAIRWFNKMAPHDFDLYSRAAIEKKFEEFRGASYLQKFVPALRQSIGTYKFKKNIQAVFKGSAGAHKKIETMKNYRFYICYENTQGINGLISEKIFDCFAASCVPIYAGAPDISRYVPANCFIDKTKFASYEDLHKFLVSMTYAEYTEYISSIIQFMSSSKTEPFKVNSFTKTIISTICNE